MPSTPAWPPSSLPRLFVDHPLGEGESVTLEGAPAHYLGTVLRLRAGDAVKLFDDRTGEYLARIAGQDRKRMRLDIGERLRPREAGPDLWLLFAPLKRARIDWLIEKATELGVSRLVPVTTQRTVASRVNLQRLRAISIEAAEQCERNALPEIAAPAGLSAVLRDWPVGRSLCFADEAGGTPFAEAAPPPPAALLIGPEGGFADEERAKILAARGKSVSLGPRILRAETAALAGIALWMAAEGDWGTPPRSPR